MQPPEEVDIMTTMHSPSAPQEPKLLDRVRHAMRAHHYSPRTDEAYVAWIKRYIFFHGKRHPAEMGAEEITRFPVRSNAPPARPGPLPSRGYPQNPWHGAPK